MKTVNQFAFEAITGYEPSAPFSSAAMDDWETVEKSTLMEWAEGQVENYATEELDGELNAELVADAIIDVRKNADSSQCWRESYESLSEPDLNIESSPKRIRLAADTINGVYACETGRAPSEVIFDMDFYEALSEPFEGTIYGNVSDEIAQKIQDEYGIH